jgi:hypothetical protein
MEAKSSLAMKEALVEDCSPNRSSKRELCPMRLPNASTTYNTIHFTMYEKERQLEYIHSKVKRKNI